MLVEGVLWSVRNGSPWRDLPEVFCDWNSVFRRFFRRAELVLTDEQRAVLGALVEACRPSGQGAAAQPAADHLGDPLAAPEQGEMARHPRGARAVVDGGPDVHPLVAARRLGAAPCRGA